MQLQKCQMKHILYNVKQSTFMYLLRTLRYKCLIPDITLVISCYNSHIDVQNVQMIVLSKYFLYHWSVFIEQLTKSNKCWSWPIYFDFSSKLNSIFPAVLYLFKWNCTCCTVYRNCKVVHFPVPSKGGFKGSWGRALGCLASKKHLQYKLHDK